MNCITCLEPYDNTAKFPNILPCGHTFCEGCIKMFGSKCPTCRAYFTIQIKNYALLELLNIQEREPRCNSHAPHMDRFCTECAKSMCRKCECPHSKSNPGSILLVKDLKKKITEINQSFSNIDETIYQVGNHFLTLSALLTCDFDTLKKDELRHLKQAIYELMDKYSVKKSEFAKLNLDNISNCINAYKVYLENAFDSFESKVNEFGFTIETDAEILEYLTTPEFQHGPKSHHTKLQNIPDYTNQAVQNTLNKYGKYIFINDLQVSQDTKSLPVLGPYLFKQNHSVYIGQWKNGKRHGRGEMYFPNGDRYIGYWKENLHHGKGRWIDYRGAMYEGDWVEDKYHGTGLYVDVNGNCYEGDWKDHKKNGTGTLSYASGDLYYGEWKNDKKHGKGTFEWADGRKYEGDFENDRVKNFLNVWMRGGVQQDILRKGNGQINGNDYNRSIEYHDRRVPFIEENQNDSYGRDALMDEIRIAFRLRQGILENSNVQINGDGYNRPVESHDRRVSIEENHEGDSGVNSLLAQIRRAGRLRNQN